MDDRSKPIRREQHATQRIVVLTIVFAVHAMAVFYFLNRRPLSSETLDEPAPTTLVPVSNLSPIITQSPAALPIPSLPPQSPIDSISEPTIPLDNTKQPMIPPAQIDWRAEAAIAAESAVAKLANQPRTRTFDRRDLPSMRLPRIPKSGDFPWDPLEGKRIGMTTDGAFFIRVNDYCMLVFLLPVCKFGKLPARGDLFKDMGKITPEEPWGDTVEPPPNP